MKQQELQTTDLSLITFLVYSLFEFSRPPQLEGNLTYFYFPKTPQLSEAIAKYVNREAMAEVLGILEASRKVKAMVWETRKAAGVKGVQHE